MISDIQKHMNEPGHKEAEKDMNDSDMYYTICSQASSPASPASPSNRTPKNILFDGIDTRRQSIEGSIPDAKNYKELITKIESNKRNYKNTEGFGLHAGKHWETRINWQRSKKIA